MNFSSILLEFLKNHGSASIPGFGTFYLNTITASLDQEGKNILPPGTAIAFKPSQSGNSDEFLKFISSRKGVPMIDAELELKKQVNYWNATLFKEKKVRVENIGLFYLEDSKMHFSAERTENLSPDFYGLEEINISEIKNHKSESQRSFQFSKYFYWIVPLVLIISALTYLGVSQPEMIFGKKSFTPETPAKVLPAVQKDTVKIDSLQSAAALVDSLKADSIKNMTAPVAAAPKKWTSKKNYSKSKWKKPRKQQNR